MTEKEIKELEVKLRRINVIKACISAANSNLKSYDKVFDGKEIRIHCNDEGAGSSAIYFTGEVMNELKSLLVKRQEEIIEKRKKELEELN